jgi:hypothetical protein
MSRRSEYWFHNFWMISPFSDQFDGVLGTELYGIETGQRDCFVQGSGERRLDCRIKRLLPQILERALNEFAEVRRLP